MSVSVSGARRDGGSVRYRCVTPHCRFAVSTQPDEVKRIDAQTYEVRVRHSGAALRPTLGMDSPGAFVVEVRAVVTGGQRTGSRATFSLTAR